MRTEGQRSEQRYNRAIAHVEAAGISAECRHDEAKAVTGKAAPAHRTPAPRYARQRMQMAGNFTVARLRRRFVAERQRTDRQNLRETPSNIFRRLGIVIAGDPDPIAAALQ